MPCPYVTLRCRCDGVAGAIPCKPGAQIGAGCFACAHQHCNWKSLVLRCSENAVKRASAFRSEHREAGNVGAGKKCERRLDISGPFPANGSVLATVHDREGPEAMAIIT